MQQKKSHIVPAKIKTLSCGEVYDHLCDNLDAKLDSESCRRIKAHIKGCRHCSSLLNSLKKTVTLYKTYKAPALSESCRQELFELVRSASAKKRSSR
jgi:hypothetical protein